MKTKPNRRKEARSRVVRKSETEKWADKIYAVGFENGQIEMQGKILKKINCEWTLVTIKEPIKLILKILKMVNKLSYTKPSKR